MKFSKLLAVGGALSASMLATSVTLANTPITFTLADWITTGYTNPAIPGGIATPGVVLDQDKIWTFVNTDLPLPSNQYGVRITTTPSPTGDSHTFTLSGLEFLANLVPTVYHFSYEIAINLSIAPLNTFANASVGSIIDQTGAPSTLDSNVEKSLTSPIVQTINSVNGAVGGPVNAPAATVVWHVTDTIDLNPNGDGGKAIFTSVSNFFRETGTTVPVPATLSLLGLGLAGIGGMTRRRKA